MFQQDVYTLRFTKKILDAFWSSRTEEEDNLFVKAVLSITFKLQKLRHTTLHYLAKIQSSITHYYFLYSERACHVSNSQARGPLLASYK